MKLRVNVWANGEWSLEMVDGVSTDFDSQPADYLSEAQMDAAMEARVKAVATLVELEVLFPLTISIIV